MNRLATYRCLKGHTFTRFPTAVARKAFCPECRESLRQAPHLYTKKVEQIHGDRIKVLEDYAGAKVKLRFRCSECSHAWQALPSPLLNGVGCPQCANLKRVRGSSKVALDWMRVACKELGIRFSSVQHADNGGEYLIPGTPYRADGFHKRSGTIFEFYGDRWHGNLNKYKPHSKPNPFSDKTAKRLNRETLAREQKLRDLGYRVVSVWEKEYKDSLN